MFITGKFLFIWTSFINLAYTKCLIEKSRGFTETYKGCADIFISAGRFGSKIGQCGNLT